MANKFIDVNSVAKSRYCSILRAARFFAFDERPVSQDYEIEVYGEHSLDTLGERQAFTDACNAIIFYLKSNQIKLFSSFREYNFRKDRLKKPYSENEESIFQEGYEGCPFELEEMLQFPILEFSRYEIIWSESKLELRETIKSPDEYDTYHECCLDTQEIIKLYSIIKKEDKRNVTGRPTKYDWESFYIATTLKAQHPDGLPEKQAHLEDQMMQWCIDNNWQEIPAQSMIKKKLSPIYQRLRKDKKV